MTTSRFSIGLDFGTNSVRTLETAVKSQNLAGITNTEKTALSLIRLTRTFPANTHPITLRVPKIAFVKFFGRPAIVKKSIHVR